MERHKPHLSFIAHGQTCLDGYVTNTSLVFAAKLIADVVPELFDRTVVLAKRST
jgi:hypothetical protein